MMGGKNSLFFFTLAVLSSGLLSCNSDDRLSGDGASFPKDFYEELFDHYYDETGARIEYGGQGSGAGITSLKNMVVDFAGSDAFLSDKELAEMPSEVIHVPSCMGAVVMGYNLPGIKGLKLTGEIIADIYLGEITQWNDPRIQEINLGNILPEKSIYPVRRSDGSGTTFVFSDYLSKVSEAWAKNIGRGKSLKWPEGVGMAAKGNANVAVNIESTEGAIGYVGSEYSFSRGIPTASLRNKAGNYIYPTLESISAAAKGNLPKDTRTMITDSEAPEAYPISCLTWLLVYKEQAYHDRSLGKAQNTINLMRWILGDEAQKLAETVDFAPLPKQIRENALDNLSKATYKGESI